MPKLSVSFTLGKASTPNTVNLKHNNRDFIAKNIDAKRVKDNVIFMQEDAEESYHKLFDEAVEEYNNQQKRKDRQIKNYYQDICQNKRTETFYEAVVQFGDVETAPCESKTGQECKKMLCEYYQEFVKRNPNLYIFNAVLHMDEATPHLHIDFIPFYTKGKKQGLSKGTSMRGALLEQGLTSSSKMSNNLVAFEEQERQAMEDVLNFHGFDREIKNANYNHMTVDEYKEKKDIEKFENVINNAFTVDSAQIDIGSLKLENEKQKCEIARLKKEKESPYVAFYYSDSEKQLFVQRELDAMGIEYRETENGFEAKEIHLQQIRNIEKNYTPKKENFREKLKADIDRLVLQSENLEELLEKLRQLNYEVKNGKYISVRPSESGNFIRLKSLGELYSQDALINRIAERQNYESEIRTQEKEAESRCADTVILRTTRMYFQAFTLYNFSMKKVNNAKPFTWKNDAVLNELGHINRKINEGATIKSFRNECSDVNEKIRDIESKIETARKNIKMYGQMYSCASVIYGGKETNNNDYNIAKQVMNLHPEINQRNYTLMPQTLNEENEKLQNMENDLKSLRTELKEKTSTLATVEKIMGETFIQSLIDEELLRQNADFIPNGIISESYK